MTTRQALAYLSRTEWDDSDGKHAERKEEAIRIVLADARRYQYLKDNARSHSPHMSGHMRLYTFRHIGNEAGAKSLDEAIDAKIAALRERPITPEVTP